MYEEFLRRLLAPLNIYDLTEQSVNGAELYALGRSLDGIAARLGTAEREALAATAEAEGLARRENLFARRPAAVTPQERRAAVAALLQIDGDSLTPGAIDTTVRGCGIPAKVRETGTGHLQVRFPSTAGIPAEFEQIQKIILDILPCHLEVEFDFRYLTWRICEELEYTWQDVETAEHTWESFSLALPPEN